jgi:hypothetical protein
MCLLDIQDIALEIIPKYGNLPCIVILSKTCLFFVHASYILVLIPFADVIQDDFNRMDECVQLTESNYGVTNHVNCTFFP